MESLITVVTPTYNRGKELLTLYESLMEQTSKNFEWLIIDDGSFDNTYSVVRQFSKSFFQIHYTKKGNGGKHTALNLAFKMVKSELTFIVDSDDRLTPDAIETIERDWENVKYKDLCGISYLRGYSTMKVIGSLFPKDFAIDNFINLRFNKHVNGDKAEVWVSKFLKEHSYPTFDGEKFFGESYIWILLAKERNMLFRNKVIYITEYLKGGLTRSGRALRIQCPHGGMENALSMMSSEFSFSQRIKGGILYVCYSIFAGYSFRKSINTPFKWLTVLCYPAGLLLYHKWKKYL